MNFEKSNFNAIIIGAIVIGLAIFVPQIINNSPKNQGNSSQNSYIKGNATEQAKTEGDRSNCDIKGNISSNGDRIYHVPGGSYYDKTQINTSAGERYFCSEEEATAAGWRKSKR